MFGGKIGIPELLVVMGVALLIFGPSKLSQLGKGLGEGIRNFKSSVKDVDTALVEEEGQNRPEQQSEAAKC